MHRTSPAFALRSVARAMGVSGERVGGVDGVVGIDERWV